MIKFQNLRRTFGSKVALDDVSFDVEEGCVTALVGPNGSGKSTALRLLLALDTADSGNATFGQRTYTQLVNPLLTVGAALDGLNAHPARSALNHLRAVALSHGIPKERVLEVLTQTGLLSVAKRRVGTYSLGMSKRLAIATAILGRPKYLILDEPTNGLDIDGLLWLRELIGQQVANGVTVLVASHSLSELEHIASDLVVLAHGKVLVQGKIASLLSPEAVIVRSSDNALLAKLLEPECETVASFEGYLRVTGAALKDIGQIAAEVGLTLHELSQSGDDLEGYYHQLVRDHTEFVSEI